MIKEYVAYFAEQMQIPLTGISLVNVNPKVEFPDVYLLKLSSGGHTSNSLLWQSDLGGLHSGLDCEPLEAKVRTSLGKLKRQMAQ